MSDFNFDSKEEKYFYHWLLEIQAKGYIKEIIRGDELSFLLSEKAISTRKVEIKTKTKVVDFSLLQQHVYTPDFKIIWNKSAEALLFSIDSFDDRYVFVANLINGEYVSYIEIKPSFDKTNMTRLFGINQKWMFAKYGIYVQKILPYKTSKKSDNCFFKETFVPEQYHKDRNIVGKDKPPLLHFTFKNCDDFIENLLTK